MIGQVPGRRVAGVLGVLGILGSCAVAVTLVQSPGPAGLVGRTAHAARQRWPPPDRPITARSRAGLRLMSQAAAACQAVAFRGVQLAAWWGSAGSSASTIQVWHQAGGEIVVQPSGTVGGSPAERQPDGAAPARGAADRDAADQGAADQGATPDQDEVMTVSSSLLTLMRANYLISYDGTAAVGGRPAQLVEVRRPGGALAARFWLDTATKLPLRRELFDSGARIFSQDTIVGLSVGTAQLRGLPDAGAQPWSGPLSAAGRAALRARGWPLPGPTAGGLTMFAATETSSKSGKVAEFSYSDGLSVISVFVQRGELPRNLPGWRRIAVDGRRVYASDPDDRSLAWSAGGFVYTMIADAATGTVDRAVMTMPHGKALPREGAPGFWKRIGRGLRRIGSWANPLH